MVAGSANGRTIYVVIVADAARLLADDAGAGADTGSATAGAAKVIGPRSPLVWAGSTAQSKRLAGNTIALDAGAGDAIRFSSKSGSNNFEDAVLIEDIGPIDDSGALQNFALVSEGRSAVAPGDDGSVFAARFPERDFWFWQCVATSDGESRCSVLLAAYGRDEQGRPRLAGHYRWALRLIVTSASPTSPTHQGETS